MKPKQTQRFGSAGSITPDMEDIFLSTPRFNFYIGNNEKPATTTNQSLKAKKQGVRATCNSQWQPCQSPCGSPRLLQKQKVQGNTLVQKAQAPKTKLSDTQIYFLSHLKTHRPNIKPKPTATLQIKTPTHQDQTSRITQLNSTARSSQGQSPRSNSALMKMQRHVIDKLFKANS